MKKKIKIFGTLFIILILVIIIIFKISKSNSLDNILIFNPYNDLTNDKYIVNINSEINQIKNINLFVDSLANAKLAPGMSGEFTIIIKSSKDFDYKIKFESKNIKPKNLVFNLKGEETKYSKLEDLSTIMRGKVYKNIDKKIVIEWVWNYENNTNDNVQDTLDGINIKDYCFDIYVLED